MNVVVIRLGVYLGEPVTPVNTNDLDGYRKFLGERTYSFEQTLNLLLAEVGAREGVKPWQLQQAANAADENCSGTRAWKPR